MFFSVNDILIDETFIDFVQYKVIIIILDLKIFKSIKIAIKISKVRKGYEVPIIVHFEPSATEGG